MKRSGEIIFLCDLCGECSERLPVVGLADEASMTASIYACPHCGPTDWELMEICRELVVGNNLS